MTDHSLNEWTPEERERLAEVGRQRSPRSELKARTMRTLRESGLLGAVQLRRPRRQFAFALAASIVIFAIGVIAGYGLGLRRQVDERSPITNANADGLAREVARVDSPATQSSATSGRHVVWF